MKALRAKLLSGGPLDLTELVQRWPEALQELAALRTFRWGASSLLQHSQRVVEWLADHDPPPTPSGTGPAAPWWTRRPALSLAAAFRHCGLPVVAGEGTSQAGTIHHAAASVLLCRRVLRRLGVPFTVRAHAEGLVRHARKPHELMCTGAPEETLMRLACRVDMRSLYLLSRAEIETARGETAAPPAEQVEAFRQKCRALSIFDGPPEPPLWPDAVAEAGFTEGPARHRVANALRYFRVCQGIADEQQLSDRLGDEGQSAGGRLNLLVGVAGSGKSRWAADNLAETSIICSDRIRAELTGDPADQSCNYQVFQRCTKRIYEVIREGGTATLDATNYREGLRSRPVATARWAGAEICTYFFDVGLAQALGRNRRRKRRVPVEVIRRQWRGLTPPALYESDRHLLVHSAGRAEHYWPAPAG